MKHTYDALAPIYDALVDSTVIETTINLITQHASHGRVLEVGCGTAAVSRRLASRGYTVDAFDDSDAMLDAAAYHIGQEGVRVNLFRHDAREAYAGGYDVVVMAVDVINHFVTTKDLTAALRHAEAALNPGGLLVFDALTADYLESLIGHKETIEVDGELWTWTVEADDEAVLHRIEAGSTSYQHRERLYPLEEILKRVPMLEEVDRVKTDSRTHLVLKK